MNKLVQLFHQYETLKNGVSVCVGTFAILETPCYPCTYYFGPANFVKDPKERVGEWYTGDNATSNFHRTLQEARKAALKRLPDVLTEDDEGNVMTHEECHSLYM